MHGQIECAQSASTRPSLNERLCTGGRAADSLARRQSGAATADVTIQRSRPEGSRARKTRVQPPATRARSGEPQRALPSTPRIAAADSRTPIKPSGLGLLEQEADGHERVDHGQQGRRRLDAGVRALEGPHQGLGRDDEQHREDEASGAEAARVAAREADHPEEGVEGQQAEHERHGAEGRPEPAPIVRVRGLDRGERGVVDRAGAPPAARGHPDLVPPVGERGVLPHAGSWR